MADAGRILIIPRGDYNANSTYDKLDLVKYKGTSWLAKKNATGVEPSKANSEYWQDVFEINIANNLTSTAEGYALDARQGKVLDEKITEINNNLGNNVKIRYGATIITFTDGTGTLTIPSGFASVPRVIVQFNGVNGAVITNTNPTSQTSVTLQAKTLSNADYNGSPFVTWIAIGN